MQLEREINLRANNFREMVKKGAQSNTSRYTFNKHGRDDSYRARRRITLLVRKDMSTPPAGCRLYIEPGVPVDKIKSRCIVNTPSHQGSDRIRTTRDQIKFPKEAVDGSYRWLLGFLEDHRKPMDSQGNFTPCRIISNRTQDDLAYRQEIANGLTVERLATNNRKLPIFRGFAPLL